MFVSFLISLSVSTETQGESKEKGKYSDRLHNSLSMIAKSRYRLMALTSCY